MIYSFISTLVKTAPVSREWGYADLAFGTEMFRRMIRAIGQDNVLGLPLKVYKRPKPWHQNASHIITEPPCFLFLSFFSPSLY